MLGSDLNVPVIEALLSYPGTAPTMTAAAAMMVKERERDNDGIMKKFDELCQRVAGILEGEPAWLAFIVCAYGCQTALDYAARDGGGKAI